MHVARLEADPVHGRQVAGRVRGVRVLDELGLAGGARGEVQQQRVVGVSGVGRLEVGGGVHRGGEVGPALRGAAHGDALVVAGDGGETLGQLVAGDHVLDAAARDAVPQVALREQGGGRDDHRTELDHGQHHVPQLDLVGEHEQDPVARLHAALAQPVGRAVGADPHLVERVLGLGGLAAPVVLLDDPQGRVVVALGLDVEPVQRPVPLVQLGPGEAGPGGVVVLGVRLQEVAGGAEPFGGLGGERGHGCSCRRTCMVSQLTVGLWPAARYTRKGRGGAGSGSAYGLLGGASIW